MSTAASGASWDKRHNALFRRVDDWFHADNAVIVADVRIGAGSSIWYGSVLRGDDAPIRIEDRVNIQDLTMVHADPGKPLLIESNVTVGHRAILHCVHIGAGSLIGMGAILMEDVEIGDGSLVAAGSVVTPGTKVPENSLVRGIPAKVSRETTAEERRSILQSAAKYAENARLFYERYGADS